MTHILILSHGFNMDGRAASQTITDKIPYLQAAGCRLTVFSAVTGSKDQGVEHRQLLPWGPSGLRFDLRHWLRLRIGNRLGYRLTMMPVSLILLPLIVLERLIFGLQSQWSWALPAFMRGWFFLRRHPGCVVYSTGGAYSAHLAASWLKRWSGVKWIAEVHDPMVRPNDEPRTRDQRFQARLEGKICTDADHVWWFTEGALASARKRHPQVAERGFVVLPGANPPVVKTQYQSGAHLVFAHFGSLGDSRSLSPFIRALGHWLEQYPECRDQVRVEIYGSALDRESALAAQQSGLEAHMICHGRLESCPVTGFSGRERVVKRMQEVDCLLLMHGMIPECPEYIPSKLYEYFWARRPVLALTWHNKQLDQLIAERGGFVAPTDDPASIVEQISKIHSSWLSGNLVVPESALPPLGVRQAVARITEACFGNGSG